MANVASEQKIGEECSGAWVSKNGPYQSRLGLPIKSRSWSLLIRDHGFSRRWVTGGHSNDT